MKTLKHFIAEQTFLKLLFSINNNAMGANKVEDRGNRRSTSLLPFRNSLLKLCRTTTKPFVILLV